MISCHWFERSSLGWPSADCLRYQTLYFLRSTWWGFRAPLFPHKLWIWPLYKYCADRWPLKCTDRWNVRFQHANERDFSSFDWSGYLSPIMNMRHYLNRRLFSELSSLSLRCYALVCEENMAATLQVFTHRIQITVLLLGLNKRAPTPIGWC